MKKLLLTSGNKSMQTMLSEWVISARRAGHTGEMLVIDYGLDPHYLNFLSHFDVKTFKALDTGSIVNTRYIDVLPILEERYTDYCIAHFDADIWFQMPMDGIFDLAAKTEGVVHSPDVGWFTQGFLGKGMAENVQYNKKVEKIRADFGGTIQGGLTCGVAPRLIAKYRQFKTLMDDNFITMQYGADQFALNWLFDFDKDSAEGHLWNVVGSDALKSDDYWISQRIANEPCIGVHVVGMLRNEKDRLYRHFRRDVYLEDMGKAGFVPPPAINVPKWHLYNSPEVWARLIGIIDTCRIHRGNAIAVGMETPAMCGTDVGCIGLVPFGHGREHYWDVLKLPRRQHIASPDMLFLSQKAVDTIADISFEYPRQLCSKFNEWWVDYMLSMMLAEHNLTYAVTG